MSDRNWQADWAWANDLDVCLSERVREMLVHYLLQVQQLEEQLDKFVVLEEAVRQHIAWHSSSGADGPCCCRRDDKILEALE